MKSFSLRRTGTVATGSLVDRSSVVPPPASAEHAPRRKRRGKRRAGFHNRRLRPVQHGDKRDSADHLAPREREELASIPPRTGRLVGSLIEDGSSAAFELMQRFCSRLRRHWLPRPATARLPTNGSPQNPRAEFPSPLNPLSDQSFGVSDLHACLCSVSGVGTALRRRYTSA